MKQNRRVQRWLALVEASDVAALLGFAAMCVGLAMISVALALVVGGTILLALGLVSHLAGKEP